MVCSSVIFFHFFKLKILILGHYLQPSASARRQCGTYNVLRKLWIISVYAMYYSEPADGKLFKIILKNPDR